MEAANSDNPPNSLAFVNLQDHSNIIESDDNEDQNWNNSNISSQTGILLLYTNFIFSVFI